MKKNTLYIFVGFTAFMNVAIVFFFVGWAAAVAYTRNLRHENIPLEIEKCDIRTSILDLERDYVDFVMNSEDDGLSDEEMEGVWELIKDEKQNQFYLNCLEEI